jgi:UDP-glucose 4-epimerase
MAIQRVLVTGGAGFIGSHTIDLLLQQDKQVLVLDNLFSGRIDNLNLQHPNLELIEGDILEYPLLKELVASCDAVLHLAAIASVPLSMTEPIYSFQVNVQGLLHLLQAVHQIKRPIRVVYASSAAIYGEVNELPCRDDKPLSAKPLSPYALQKLNCEEYADLYAHLHQINSLGLRYFNVYGPRQDPNSPYSGVISRFLEAYQNNVPLTVYGDGLQSRDFINVADIARANILALESQYHGALNIASGQPETLLKMIECIETAGQRPAMTSFQPAREGDIKASYALTQMAEKHIGFKSTISLQQGIAALVRGKV